MPNTSHTPTPWATKPLGDYHSVFDANNHMFEIARVRGFDNHDAKANAALIVKAVNSHEKLLGSLKRITEILIYNIPAMVKASDVVKARAAISEAEGGL